MARWSGAPTSKAVVRAPDTAGPQTTTPTTSPTPASTPQQVDNAERGDLLVQGLWNRSTSCILDVRVTNTDAPSYLSASTSKVIERQEREKKKKYLEACLEERRHFTPYVVDCFGSLGEEARAVNQRLASKLARKWRVHYSVTMGYVNARISVAILRAVQLCIRGSRVPFRDQGSKVSAWEDGAGLNLFQCDQ